MIYSKDMDYSDLLSRMASELRSAEKDANEMVSKIDSIRKEYSDKIELHRQKAEDLFNTIFQKAKRQRNVLTEGGKIKTISISAGEFGWRKAADCVEVTNEQKVIAKLEELGLVQFIKTEKTLRKSVMLSQKQLIKDIEGVKIGKREFFFVKPQNMEAISKRSD
jgi:phage host-nuclease inhibitor protein Gam